MGSKPSARPVPIEDRTVAVGEFRGQAVFREINTNTAFVRDATGELVQAGLGDDEAQIEFNEFVDPFRPQKEAAAEQNRLLQVQLEETRAETLTPEKLAAQIAEDRRITQEVQSLSARQSAQKARRSGTEGLINPGLSVSRLEDEEV